uniref:Uncharacterized protein AlNc14C535G12085 n=1 Tax=Albugo laibachii Nc14 TaxID=890382 RepID=F0X0Z8_9STRA|nr:hypothetical protein PITG_16835 [Albugo laibachii Nc14]|eukprot:CCA27444.1 hypothetical protein PITG_16835 [Albugo laibachii Nc14]
MANSVPVVRAQGRRAKRNSTDVLMSVLTQNEKEVGREVQKSTLMHFHRGFLHLNYDAIIRMAQDPASGIILTHQIMEACAQGKQTENVQVRKDTGENSPIDVIGGVVCSDLKGPINLKDRPGYGT